MNTTARGRELEDYVAEKMGGRRSPSSGRVDHQSDILVPRDETFGSFAIECKMRKSVPAAIANPYAQARRSLPHHGNQLFPAVVLGDDDGNRFFIADLDHFVTYVAAIAEVGSAAHIRSCVRSIRRDLDRIEAKAR